MTDAEKAVNLEILVHKLRAERAELSARCDKLQNMHRNAQSHIQTLQRAIDGHNRSDAEKVFK
jgi:FtsZ-binding cell division protein ZapB